tara:strand:+ start:52 stop:459 length:408 start_codon:yes stop_codon:yes gene_type:complete
MTIDEYFKDILKKKEKQRKIGMLFLLISFALFPVIFILSFIVVILELEVLAYLGNVVQVIYVLIFFTGASMLVWSILSLHRVIVCPNCGKVLSYLVTDSNYTNNMIILGIPQQMPEGVDYCPFCHVGFNDEISQE